MLGLLAGGALAFGQLSGTFAVFNAASENQGNLLVGGWVPEPSGTNSAPPTSDPYSAAMLSWTPGANPPVTSQTLQYADGGSGSNASCPSAGSASYGAFSTPAAGSNSASVTGNDISDWWCFEINSTDGNWTTDYVTFPAVRIFVPISVVLGDGGGTPGQSENGDTITITYNQDVSVKGTVAVHVCHKQNLITIGSGCTGTPSIGEITGVSVDTNNSYTGSTIDVSGPTITITLQNQSGLSTVSGGGAFIATGSKVTAAADGTNVCGDTACQPTSSGSF